MGWGGVFQIFKGNCDVLGCSFYLCIHFIDFIELFYTTLILMKNKLRGRKAL